MTKSWNVSYSCRVKGCRWVTSKKKALLCISPHLLSVVLPSDATCSTTRLLVSDAREFLLRFNTPTEVNECQRLMTDSGAFEWRHGRGLQSQGSVLDIPTDTQLPSSQMDVEEEEMTQCSQVESSPPEPASAQAEVFTLLPRSHIPDPPPAAVLPFAGAPISPQRVGPAPAASTPNYSFPPQPIMVDAAYSAASSSSSTSSSAPATSSSLGLRATLSSAPVRSSTAATPAATSAGFFNFGTTSAPSNAVATDAEDIEITEGNFEFYLSMCLNDPRFPMIVEQVEKAWVRHMGLGGTAAESLERLMK